MVKIVVLAHKSYVYDHLERRIAIQIQLELSSDRKKYQGFAEIEKNESFEMVLERLKKKARCIPSYRRLCIYLVDSDRPTLVENARNVL